MFSVSQNRARPVSQLRNTGFEPLPALTSRAPKRLDAFQGVAASGRGATEPTQWTEKSWQAFCEQFRPAAEKELARKRASAFPDKDIEKLVHQGAGPVYVGHWSTVPGKDRTPIFFQYVPGNRDPRLQLYTFPRDGQWVSFEVAGNFFKAYDSETYLHGNRGTSSPLGFPDSGTELASLGSTMPFAKDPEVANLLNSGAVKFQKFENGYMVDLGGGRVQSFDLDGKRMGKPFPDGAITDTPGPVTPTDGIHPQGVFKNVFKSHELIPGISVPTRLGVHWGPGTAYADESRVNRVADLLRQRGVGFATVIVDSKNVEGQLPTLKALLSRGIQPVIRLQCGATDRDYNTTMDQLSEEQMQSIADGAAKLKALGINTIQLDNEPNWGEGGKELYGLLNDPQKQPEYEAAMKKYVANLSHTMDLINERAPGMAIGWAAFAPGKDNWTKMWGDLMWGMKAENDKRGGKLLQNTWIATHPYTIGIHDPDLAKSQGVENAEWMQRNARAILGFNINTLATEGGNPTDFPDRQQQASSDLCLGELANMGRNFPDATQCFWIVGDQILSGEKTEDGQPKPGQWEKHTFLKAHIDARGNEVWDESILFKNMLRVARGEITG